ncbi:reverse transcriptase-like protein [Intrasporangium sp.]|uniref:reverse transcriptase-like protein n=1 Tax=Intrasporangium sp. TaxID=1925024 RepID=UPI003F7DE9F8
MVEADGGSRGNPGVAGYGALVREAESKAVLVELAEPLGQASNNVAEYSGLIAGLAAAFDIDPGADVTVQMDSKLVIEQMAGRWKIKHADMRRLALEARDICAQISAAGGTVDFQWVPRERNKAADALSTEGMDGHHVHRDLREEPDLATPVEGSSGISASDGAGTPTGAEHAALPAVDTREAPVTGDGLRLLLVQFPTEQAQAASVAGAALELLGRESRVTAAAEPLATQVACRIAESLGVEVAESDDWAGTSGAAGADERVLAAYHSLCEQGGTVVAVTTRRAVLTVLAEVLGLAPDRFWTIATAPGSLSAVEVWPDGTASVAFTNRTAHLR